jgi:hypothetical protein
MERQLAIYPGIGVGPIRLGMRPAEVLFVFGEAQVYENWMGGNLNDALLFHGMRLHFGNCDARAPLPESTLNWIVIHQRDGVLLFDRPMKTWTKNSIFHELRSRGYAVEALANGDIEVPGKLSLSFEDNGRLIWLEI